MSVFTAENVAAALQGFPRQSSATDEHDCEVMQILTLDLKPPLKASSSQSGAAVIPIVLASKTMNGRPPASGTSIKEIVEDHGAVGGSSVM